MWTKDTEKYSVRAKHRNLEKDIKVALFYIVRVYPVIYTEKVSGLIGKPGGQKIKKTILLFKCIYLYMHRKRKHC